jgi:hypothetical protein
MTILLTKLLFESPWLLGPLVGLSTFLMLYIWAQHRSRRTARLVWGTLLIGIALLIVQAAVETDRERLRTICAELAEDVEKEDVSAIARRLAADVQAGRWGKEELVDVARSQLSRYRLDRAKVHDFSFEFPQEGEAVVEMSSVCNVGGGEGVYDRLTIRWRLTFRESNGQWLITVIDVVPTMLSPVRKIGDLQR